MSKFRLRAGQIDYTHARWAPVINCVAKYRGKILVVQRSRELNFYPGCWNGISGFLDDNRTLEQKVKDEFREELGIRERQIKRIRLGAIFHQEARAYRKTWIVHPILVELATDKASLNWEASDYRWIKPSETRKFKLLPGFDTVLEKLTPWL